MPHTILVPEVIFSPTFIESSHFTHITNRQRHLHAKESSLKTFGLVAMLNSFLTK